MTDMVNHPPHYAAHPRFTCECIELTRLMSFDAGNAFKYLWRHELKGTSQQDVEKARFYVRDVIAHDRLVFSSPANRVKAQKLFGEHVRPFMDKSDPLDMALGSIVDVRLSQALSHLDQHLG